MIIMNQLKKLLFKLFAKWSLQKVIIIPFILQILLATSLTGTLAFTTSKNAIKDLTEKLQEEILSNVHQFIDGYLQIPPLINRVNAVSIQKGHLDIKNNESLISHFLQQIQVKGFDSVSLVYFGNQNGEFFGIEKREGELLIKKSTSPSSGKRDIYAVDEQGNEKDFRGTFDYNVLERPWYQTATKIRKPTWSEIYIFADVKEPGLTATYPVYDNDGTLYGVLGVDLYLTDINTFLKDLKNTQSTAGEIFIIERQTALMVASSTDERVFDEENNQIKAIQSKEPLINQTIKYLSDEFNDISLINEYKISEINIDGKKFFLQVAPYNDALGLDWLIITVDSESAIMKGINTGIRRTIIMSVLGLALTIAIGIVTAQWIVEPISKLNLAAKDIAKQNWGQTITVNREDEVGELTNAFNKMTKQLQTMFNNLQVNVSRHRSLFEGSKAAIIISKPSGEIIEANAAALHLFGYNQDEFIGHTMQEIYLNPDDRLNLWLEIEKNDFVTNYEVKLKRHDGTEIDVSISASSQQAQDGLIIFQKIITDISKQKQIEETLANYSRKLEREVAERTAKLKLYNKQFEEDMEIARKMQQTLLPPPAPEWRELDVFCVSHLASMVGGDFYTYHTFENDSNKKRFALAVGDVQGEGVAAVMLMSTILTAFDSQVAEADSPSEFLASLDKTIIPFADMTTKTSDMVYTEITYGETTTQIRAVNANNVPPIIRRSNGTVNQLNVSGPALGEVLASDTDYIEVKDEVLSGDLLVLATKGVIKTQNKQNISGSALGKVLASDADYIEVKDELLSGDLLVLATKGIIKTQNKAGQLFGLTRLEKAIANGPNSSAVDMIHHLQNELTTFINGAERTEDVTIVVCLI